MHLHLSLLTGQVRQPEGVYRILTCQGYYTRYSHQRDIALMATLNGIERTPREFRNIIERANLKLLKIWDCRSQVGLVEVVLPDSELV